MWWHGCRRNNVMLRDCVKAWNSRRPHDVKSLWKFRSSRLGVVLGFQKFWDCKSNKGEVGLEVSTVGCLPQTKRHRRIKARESSPGQRLRFIDKRKPRWLGRESINAGDGAGKDESTVDTSIAPGLERREEHPQLGDEDQMRWPNAIW
ncbi:hypothetical protein F2Q69_00023452 [Brassica cretica]|uniref:Uncharacterized protein n=1 Tax=Brassica cretica TaxID=69181 RepID=A0A8S9QHX1_BRACR|nr:hypothetical protein F2Q69_00023452 [Brassica cretica]